MDVEPAGGASLIRKLKPRLIDALYGDPDYLLQHCHSSGLLTQKQYDHVKACAVPWDKARDILDSVMSKDEICVQRFLSLLKEKEIQEEFPKLAFLKQLPQDKPTLTGGGRKNSEEKQPVEDIPRNQASKAKKSRKIVTEKQLMMVSRYIGTNWKEVGRVALEVSNVRLEQIVEENPHSHRERVFSMLHLWSRREREQASASRLYELLTQQDFGVDPGSINFLLEKT